MGGGRQTKAQLLAEIDELRRKVATLEAAVAEHHPAEGRHTNSESSYRAVVECSIQGIAVQRYGTVLFANPMLATILGYTDPHDVIGLSVESHIAAEDRERLQGHLTARLRGSPTPARYECQGLKKDGTPIWLEVAPAIVLWDGEPAVLISLIDITARKQAEQALQQSDFLYRTVLSNIHDGVFLIQDNRILLVNKAGAQIVSAHAEALLGKSFLALVSPESVGRVTDCFRYCEEFGQSPAMDEVFLISQDSDRHVIVQVQAARLADDEQKTILVTLKDVTAHKHAEKTITEEAEIAAALARVGQALIASLETPVVLDRVCQLTTTALGCDCSYVTLWDPQKNLAVTVAGYGDSPEQEEVVRNLPFPTQLFTEGLAGESNPDTTVEICSADQPALQALLQRVGIVSAVFFLFRRGTRTVGALSVGYRRPQSLSPRRKRLARGIAQLASFALANAKLLEELENSNRIKEDFVGTMSHELRTPLHILYGYTELLRDEAFGPLTPQQADILGRVERNVRELTTLINTTLDLSRLQSRRIPLVIQEVHVPELLAELTNEIRQLNHTADLELEWSCAPEVPPLWTDLGKLKIILKNLVTNALKFTERGKISISAVPQGEGVTFSVSDTGVGIPADVLPFIFEAFRQGGSFTTRKQGGVGLGLYIVQRLLELLGGTVTVESEIGKGSTFYVWIPPNTPAGRQI